MSRKFALLTVLFLGVFGCEETKGTKADSDAGVPDGGPTQPIADQHIVDAVASAASSGDPAAADENSPPPNGVFLAGEADRRQPHNAPLKVTVAAAGADPLIKYLPVNTFVGPRRFEVTVAFAEGRAQHAVKLDVMVTLPVAVAKKATDAPPGGAAPGAAPKTAPKQEAKGGAKTEGEGEAPAAPIAGPVTKPTPIHFTIIGARSHDRYPLQDKELKILNTLKGTRISGVITPSGALTGETFELPKKADPTKVAVVRALVDSLGIFFTPWPAEPVGLGGFWIASDRATMGGLDLVRYRVYKLEQVGQDLLVTVDLKMYAAGPNTLPPGTPAGWVARTFEGAGKAAMTRKHGQMLPIQAEFVVPPMVLQVAESAEAVRGQAYQVQYQITWVPFQAPKPGDDKGAPKGAPAAP